MMAWLSAHWTAILTIWGMLWALATALQSAFPVGSVAYRICHAFLAVSPLDFVKAAKQFGAGLVPPMACLALFLLGCAGASTPPTKTEEASIYASQIAVCVQANKSRVDIDKCRDGVEQAWCGPGGALAGTPGCLDAGAGK